MLTTPIGNPGDADTENKAYDKADAVACDEAD